MRGVASGRARPLLFRIGLSLRASLPTPGTSCTDPAASHADVVMTVLRDHREAVPLRLAAFTELLGRRLRPNDAIVIDLLRNDPSVTFRSVLAAKYGDLGRFPGDEALQAALDEARKAAAIP